MWVAMLIFALATSWGLFGFYCAKAVKAGKSGKN
jgi:hypothetical protein